MERFFTFQNLLILWSLGLFGVSAYFFWKNRMLALTLQERQEALTLLTERHHHIEKKADQAEHFQEQVRTLEIELEGRKATYEAEIRTLQEAKEALTQSFQALSAKALEQNNRSFMTLAESTLGRFHEMSKGHLDQKEKSIQGLVSPLKESLGLVDQKLAHLEKERESAYQVLRHQVSELISSQKELRQETGNLSKALRAPHVRGRWGEMQLRRVVEMSGMSAHCDFVEQAGIQKEETLLRPDMIVKLPGKKCLVIDAKAPLSSYLEALEVQDGPQRRDLLKAHARHVRQHVVQLSSRSYWDHINREDTPEFVVLFLPGDTFFSAALEEDPSLIEYGIEKKVILATPATLIALLHSVAYGWRQESLAENAREISALGKELFKRIGDMTGHFTKLGQDINRSVRSYNQAIGSLESRVLPSAKRFRDLKAVAEDSTLPSPAPVEMAPRLPSTSGGPGQSASSHALLEESSSSIDSPASQKAG